MISVVVSARDARETIERAVRAMVAQEGAPPHEVVVVDNASKDDTGERARAAGARVLRLDDRAGGPGAARNHGVREARGSIIAFTDADCVPEPDWLRAVDRAMRDADLVAGAILPDATVDRSHWDRTISNPSTDPLYPTANLAIRRELFEAAGGFRDWMTGAGDEAPSHPYGEDTVMAWKALRAGARVVHADDAVVRHAVFREGAAKWVERHGEMGYLPALVRMVPELRREMLLYGLFASKRTAATSAAAAGLAAALLSRRALPLVAGVPFAVLAAKRTRAMGPAAAAVWTAADVRSVAALAAGSARARTLVL